jgi:hypothetical protein
LRYNTFSRVRMLRCLCCVGALWFALPLLAQQLSISSTPDSHAAVIGDVFSSDAGASGSVVLAGGSMRLLSGSTVKAGAHAASVRLARGGELRVCPDTGVAVNGTASRDLMLSLSAGAMEAHYSLPSSDVVLTPDFRIVLAGPGELHIAVAADYRGNGCVKSLAGNTVPVLVAELMGTGTLQLSPGEQVYFRDGSVTNPSFRPLMNCGCPGPSSQQREVQTATQAAPTAAKPPQIPRAPAAPSQVETQLPPQEAVSADSLPISMPGDVHVEVEAPLVFSAREVESAPEPSVIADLQPLQTPALFDPLLKNEVTAPAPAVSTKEKKRRGFFGRIGGFFAAMFRGK